MFLPHKNICTTCSQFPVYYKWPLICSTRRKYFPVLSSFMTYSWVCILEYNHGRVPLVEQEWSPFLSSPRFLVGFVLLIFLFFCVMFCRSLFVLFSFDHSVVWPSSIYGLWLRLFNTIPRTKRSHGHKRIQHSNVKKSSKPRTLEDTFNDLLSNIQKPLGIHHIRTILF